jgi:hypothetical protein
MEPVHRVLLWSLVVLVWLFIAAVAIALAVERFGVEL